jgi:hypothetical protein
MMSQQITARHRQRLACLYVRQSTLQQVFEHTESTARQYALRDRALARGWPAERIMAIDQDLGHSGPQQLTGRAFSASSRKLAWARSVLS